MMVSVLDDITDTDFENSRYTFGHSEKRYFNVLRVTCHGLPCYTLATKLRHNSPSHSRLQKLVFHLSLGSIQSSNLRGEKLNCKSVAKEISKPPFLAPEVQWESKFTMFCLIHVSFKCFEPHPYLVCHMTTIENV